MASFITTVMVRRTSSTTGPLPNFDLRLLESTRPQSQRQQNTAQQCREPHSTSSKKRSSASRSRFGPVLDNCRGRFKTCPGFQSFHRDLEHLLLIIFVTAKSLPSTTSPVADSTANDPTAVIPGYNTRNELKEDEESILLAWACSAAK